MNIDVDGGGSLSKEELQEWFNNSSLVGLMTFREFYSPIAAMDADESGECDAEEFLRLSHSQRT